MKLTVARVERLLEEHRDRQALADVRVSPDVDNAALRRLLAEQRRRDPGLTVTGLARRIGTSPVQVERWLGLRETAAKTSHSGRRYPGRTLQRVSVDAAGRIARGLGYAPCELDGL
ncbi:MAG TPA: hypothetical protein VI300_23050 [Solirubrobacter sp.]